MVNYIVVVTLGCVARRRIGRLDLRALILMRGEAGEFPCRMWLCWGCKAVEFTAMNESVSKGKKSAMDIAELVGRMGFKNGMTVQEVGWDDDCDSQISESIEDIIDDELLDEDTDEICDVVLLWWRSDDGDLVDGLVDAVRPLGEDGRVWLLSPGAGKQGALEPGVISESAQLAGMVQTKAERLGQWQAAMLVPSRSL